MQWLNCMPVISERLHNNILLVNVRLINLGAVTTDEPGWYFPRYTQRVVPFSLACIARQHGLWPKKITAYSHPDRQIAWREEGDRMAYITLGTFTYRREYSTARQEDEGGIPKTRAIINCEGHFFGGGGEIWCPACS